MTGTNYYITCTLLRFCISTALPHGSLWVGRAGFSSSSRCGFLMAEKKACSGVEVWDGQKTIPSEQAAQPHREKRCHQKVGDSIEVERREGHNGHGQGERTPGGQMEELTAGNQETRVKLKTRLGVEQCGILVCGV